MSMQAQPKDVIDQHLNKLLDFQYEDRQRIVEKAGRVQTALSNMMRILLASNTNEKLVAVRLALKDGKPQPELDRSGWDLNPAKLLKDSEGREIRFMDEAREVDKAMSLLVDIYLHMIRVLSKADEVKNVQVQQPQVNAQGFQQERRGLLDGFRSFVDSLKPKWQQDYQHGMSIVSSLFDDMSNARVKWEEYKSQHWQNIGKAVEFNTNEFGTVMLEELEALDDVSMRIMRMLDIGIRLLQTEQSARLVSLANVMVSIKTAQLQQAMMPALGAMQQVPSNGHQQ
jgi:hypothetical protein